VIGLHVKYPLFLSDFNATLIFLTDFFKNTQVRNLMKNRPVGIKLFHAARQAHMDNEANRPWRQRATDNIT